MDLNTEQFFASDMYWLQIALVIGTILIDTTSNWDILSIFSTRNWDAVSLLAVLGNRTIAFKV